jgi:hypothetical protein
MCSVEIATLEPTQPVPMMPIVPRIRVLDFHDLR